MNEKLYYFREKHGDKRYVSGTNSDLFTYSLNPAGVKLFNEKYICLYYSRGKLETHDLFEIELGKQVSLVINFEPVLEELKTSETAETSEVTIKD